MYPNKPKSYFRGENKDKLNWNTEMEIYINRYYQYTFLHNKHKLFSVLSNLQTESFRIDSPKKGPEYI